MDKAMPQKYLIAAIGIILILAGTSTSQAQPSMDRNIDQYECRDVMRDSGVNRDVAIAFLHGFLLGKSGSAGFNLDKIKQQTDAFIERCLSNRPRKRSTR